MRTKYIDFSDEKKFEYEHRPCPDCGESMSRKSVICRKCWSDSRQALVGSPRLEITAIEVAWVAGILEGEGCWTKCARQLRIACTMTDEDTIRKLHTLTGVGTVVYRQPKGNRKPVWTWSVYSKGHVNWVTNLVWDWLSIRRKEQATEHARLVYW